MASTNRRVNDRKRMLTVALVLLLALLIAVALWNFLQRGGGGGGTTTTTATPGPGGGTGPVVLYPGNVLNPYDLIVIEDHIEVVDGTYVYTATTYGSFVSLVAYGGSSVTGNITSGMAVIKWGDYIIPVVGFASTNRTLVVDYPGINVRLDDRGGYVHYQPPSMTIYYRRLTFNISSTTVYVWLPAKSLPTTLGPGSYHVVVDPVHGIFYVNNVPYTLTTYSTLEKKQGVLRGWLVITDKSGRYTITINP